MPRIFMPRIFIVFNIPDFLFAHCSIIFMPGRLPACLLALYPASVRKVQKNRENVQMNRRAKMLVHVPNTGGIPQKGENAYNGKKIKCLTFGDLFFTESMIRVPKLQCVMIAVLNMQFSRAGGKRASGSVIQGRPGSTVQGCMRVTTGKRVKRRA
jgi:hypothetical protein